MTAQAVIWALDMIFFFCSYFMYFITTDYFFLQIQALPTNAGPGMDSNAENRPKRWLGCCLGPRYIFFFCILLLLTTIFFFFYRYKHYLRRQGWEWVAMQKTGPDDGQAVDWALGMFFFSICLYSITTNYFFFADTSITYKDRARNGQQ